ncbi:MAG: hypothetical protein CL908_00310 [Deltaproteobacteria bacterium]|nr:hypothetical protein [Deltaproteobacteria bacterium]
MRIAIRLLFSALAGFLLALWLQSPVADSRSDVETEGVAPEGIEVAMLRAELEEERMLRKRREVELVWLEIALEELLESGTASEDEADGEQSKAGNASPETLAGDLGLRDDVLSEAGMDGEEIARIRERWERFRLDLLYFQDQNARGERSKSERLRERALMEAELIEDLGEDRYDVLLYASGQNNRIVVTNVLADSEAEWAGIRVGDQVIAYDDMRTWKPRDLKLASRAGEKGELTGIRVWREDHLETLYLERGPLGIEMKPKSLPPLPVP